MINISIDEAIRNFLNVIQIVDENGAAVILKDDRQYILHEYTEKTEKDEYIDSIKFRKIAENILDRHIEAFKELAK